MNKEMQQATERELVDWPGVTMTEEQGKKHSKVMLHYNGQSRMVFVSSTPSDVRALPNHLSVVRKEIRALGAERAQIVAGGQRPKTATKPKSPIAQKEQQMSKENKQKAIFKSIGELRYAEMLQLAEFLRDVATVENLRRGDKRSWASTLQAAVDASEGEPPS